MWKGRILTLHPFCLLFINRLSFINFFFIIIIIIKFAFSSSSFLCKHKFGYTLLEPDDRNRTGYNLKENKGNWEGLRVFHRKERET